MGSGCKGSTLDRYVGYSGELAYADKIIKAIGYSLSTVGHLIKAQNCGVDTCSSEGLIALYRSIVLSRCLFRFVGITDALGCIKNDTGASKWPEAPRILPLSRLQAWSLVWYHAFEHIAWAASVAPKFIKADKDKWFAVSDWGWLAYCVLDAWMNHIKMKALRRREAKMKLQKLQGKDVSAQESEIRAAKRAVGLQQLRMLFYIPNAVHWAFEQGPFPGVLVGGLGLAEAIVGLVQSFPRG